jgi:hypothetical protein
MNAAAIMESNERFSTLFMVLLLPAAPSFTFLPTEAMVAQRIPAAFALFRQASLRRLTDINDPIWPSGYHSEERSNERLNGELRDEERKRY